MGSQVARDPGGDNIRGVSDVVSNARGVSNVHEQSDKQNLAVGY